MRAVLIALVLFCQLTGPARAAQDKPDYRGKVARIEAMLNEAASDYRAGKADLAKATVQNAYFQIFESLEGPIRINISPKKSYELEREFGAIRKLISDGAVPEQVEKRIAAHVDALDAVIPILENGAVLNAQASESRDNAASSASTALESPPQKVEPYWQQAVTTIRDDLLAAADALDQGDVVKAKALIRRAQFDGYKNSQLEIAIRQYVSQQQDAAYEVEFTRITGLVNDNRPSALIRGSARVLADDLTSHLPGLPLVGAGAEKAETGPAPASDWSAVVAKVNAAVFKAVTMAGNGNAAAAVGLLQNTYFDVFEASGMEARVGARDESFKTVLEGHFSKLIALASDGAAVSTLAAEAEAMKSDLERAAAMLGRKGGDSPATLFGYALLIILREGFEAMVIVTALIAYLVKTGHGDKQRVIGNSVIVALLASLGTAILLKVAFRESAAGQEVLEGGTMLVAAAILFSVSYWLVSKAEAQKWTAYIKGKVESSLSSGSIRALWFTSFLAVYREGAETVLFYQALTTDANAMGLAAIAAGFVLGCLGLGLVYWGMRAGALRLPIRPFFQATGALLYLMAFAFVGKGVMELVEGKVFTPTPIPWAPELQALGVYPYWQSLLPQAVLVIAALVSLAVILRRRAGVETVHGRGAVAPDHEKA